jgi:hypothetical protein
MIVERNFWSVKAFPSAVSKIIMIFDKFDSLVCNGKLTSMGHVIFDLTLFLGVKSVT